ncbi:MAG TPA: hypothetical protein VIP09_12210 [Dehalococcoidia bacterium]
MTTLNIRNIDDAAAAKLKRGSDMRGLTLAQYLAKLADLHDMVRARADAGDDALQAELIALGLETVSG